MIQDGRFPQAGEFRGTNKIVNIADRISPTPITGNETLSVSGTPETLTVAQDAVGAYIFVEVAPIRFWVTGDNPTATAGVYVAVGGNILLESEEELAGFKAIAATDTDAVLQISYWG